MKFVKIITAAAIVLTVLMLSACSTQSVKDSDGFTVRTNAETEDVSLVFNSVEAFKQVLKDYKDNDKLKNDQNYISVDFENLDVKGYPVIENGEYEMLYMEVNRYNVFYYFVPSGSKTFDHDTGIVVTFPREGKTTINSVGKQLHAVYEEDGSFFYSENNTWFVPYKDSFYDICFPKKTVSPDKNTVKIIELTA
jgi:hypothetical protein